MDSDPDPGDQKHTATLVNILNIFYTVLLLTKNNHVQLEYFKMDNTKWTVFVAQ
jgi:hypothetical protein